MRRFVGVAIKLRRQALREQLRIEKLERHAIVQELRQVGVRVTCDIDGYLMRDYHSQLQSYFRCRNGHVLSWAEFGSKLEEWVSEGD